MRKKVTARSCFALAAAAVTGICATVAQAQDCKLVEITSLDSRPDRAGGLIVPATIEGHDAYLLVDTAGIYNLLTTAAIDEMHLSRGAAGPDLHIALGATGKTLNTVAIAHEFKLGNLVASRMPFLEMPTDMVPGNVAGTLGPIITANYDLEIDPAHDKVNLFSRDHCPGKVVYWTHAPYAAIPMRLDSTLHIIVPVQIDGQSFEGTIDTGSSTSSLIYELARDAFHWNEDSSALTPWSPDGADTGIYRYPFKTLSFGGIQVANPQVAVRKDRDISGEKTPLIIGMDVLRRLHTYISYDEHMLYVTAADAQ